MLRNIGIRLHEQYSHCENPETLIDRFTRVKNPDDRRLHFQVIEKAVFMKVPPPYHRWWSPELTVTVEKSDNGSVVKEVTGPNPSTFTLSMFVIIGAAVILFFAIIFAFSQISLNTSPVIALMVSGGCIIVVTAVLGFLALGRKKAHSQIKLMKQFVKETLDRN